MDEGVGGEVLLEGGRGVGGGVFGPGQQGERHQPVVQRVAGHRAGGARGARGRARRAARAPRLGRAEFVVARRRAPPTGRGQDMFPSPATLQGYWSIQ